MEEELTTFTCEKDAKGDGAAVFAVKVMLTLQPTRDKPTTIVPPPH
jgi:hypothetical protein